MYVRRYILHSSGDMCRAILQWRTREAVPSRKTWRRPLKVRQPKSVAVPSTRGRLHPLVPEEREAWRERWSSPCRRDGEVEKLLL